MKGVRELKRRLKGVKNIRKITKAIELVAGTKLRRLQDRAAATRPFAAQLEGILRRVAAYADVHASPLLKAADEVKRVAVIVIASDKGLCGSYNSNVFRAATPFLRELKAAGKEADLYVLGRRAATFFGKLKDVRLEWVYPDALEKIEFKRVKALMGELVRRFVEDKVQEVVILYTAMKGAMSFKPTLQRVLPVPRPETGSKDASPPAVDYILEPTPQEIMARLLPRFLDMQLYAAILESLASEFASRRAAMKNATDNADEMASALNKEYNKARQSGITAELLEITGGAEALRAV
ncbi:MAG TPA: ATP synthase F1 subunit gamma [Planctomycetota bacterium]|nr:ATP synthase F1 subunit gamma [Planctomycetota bacterium]